MKNKLNTNKGITLIALVITIIVLLILAGVAISMLTGDNGILRQVANAKTQTDEKSLEERVKLAVITAMTNKNHTINKDDLEKELTKEFGEGNYIYDKEKGIINVERTTYEIGSDGKITKKEIPVVTTPPTTAVTEKTKYRDESSVNTTTKEAVIPKGFRVSENTDEQNIDTGLVVIAPDGSEFVWVPVDDINTMYEEVTLTDGTKKKVGTLYDFTKGADPTKIPWTEDTTSYREPDVLTDSSSGDWATTSPSTSFKAEEVGIGALKSIVGLKREEGKEETESIKEKWTKQLQDEFEEMIKYVREAKGFYVARYEMSIRTEGEEKIAQSKKGEVTNAYNVDSKTWYGLYQKAKEYSIKNTNITNIVGSSMIWGSQYDQMMLWMKKNGYDVASSNSDDLKGAEKNTSNTETGTKDSDQLNKVYDLLGCKFEWTLEANEANYRVYRRR